MKCRSLVCWYRRNFEGTERVSCGNRGEVCDRRDIPPALAELGRGTPIGTPIGTLIGEGGGESLDFEVDAGNVVAAFLGVAASALAKFRETNVAVLAEFKTGGDQDCINIKTGLALKLEQHAHGAGIAGAAAENPAAAAEDTPGESLHQAGGILNGYGFHLQRPRDVGSSACVVLCPVEPHVRYIGGRAGSLIVVPESNGV